MAAAVLNGDEPEVNDTNDLRQRQVKVVPSYLLEPRRSSTRTTSTKVLVDTGYWTEAEIKG